MLFLLHLPPPVHGSSMVGQYIKNSSLINDSFKSSYIDLLASKDVNDTGKVSLKKIIFFINVWFKLIKELIKNKPEICYFALTTKGFAFFKDVFLVVLLKIFNIKIIYHLHNKGVSKKQENVIYKLCYSYIFKNEEVILLSKYLYPDIDFFVNKKQVHVCPNGIPKIKYEKEKRVNKTPKILFLSNLIESKGVYVLLESLKQLKEKKINFECNFVGGEGDVTNKEFEAKLKELKLEKEVRYLGKKYDNAKFEIFIESDIFVFPTYYSNECFPLVLLEAMNFSLPIISTFEGGIRDIVDDYETGYLVNQNNVEQLTNKIEVLIKNPKIALDMGRKGKLKFENEFILEKFEINMINILKKALVC